MCASSSYADELVAGLRAKGYVLSAKNDLQALMNNKQTFAVWIQQAVTTQVEIADSENKNAFPSRLNIYKY